MFIVKDKKITNSKVLDLGKRRSVDLAFDFDASFEDTDKFQLSIADNKNTLYGFTNSGKLSFAKVDFDFIGKEETEVAVSIKHNGTEILADSINVLTVIQGGGVGGSSDVQGIIYNAFPIKNSTQVKIIPPELTKDATTFSEMFLFFNALTSVPAMDTSNGTTFYGMFNGCSALTSVPAMDTSNGTNFGAMFNSCSALTSVPALDTSNGTTFNHMFQGCSALTSVALDTSNGTNFSVMFNGCSALTSVVLDTSNGTNFNYMFQGCKSLTSVPALDTSNGTDFGAMFNGCSALTTIQGIDFSSVTSAISSDIFNNCSALKNVTFNGTLSQSINISNAPNLSKQSLQSLVDACVAVSNPKYITATGNALSILNSYFKTKLTNKNWGIKEG